MELKNTLTEENFRKELNASILRGKKEQSTSKINEELLSLYPDFKSAITLDWIPEEGENIYTILIDQNLVVKIEISKNPNAKSILIESMDIKTYHYKLKKLQKLKLKVALDIALSIH